MQNFAYLLIAAGLVLAAVLVARSERGRKISEWVWVAIVVGGFWLVHWLKPSKDTPSASPGPSNGTPASPPVPEIPTPEERATTTESTALANATPVTPADSMDEFRRRAEKDLK